MLHLVRLAHPVYLSIPADAHVRFFSYLARTRMDSKGVDNVLIHPSLFKARAVFETPRHRTAFARIHSISSSPYVDPTDPPRLPVPSPSSLSSPLSATFPSPCLLSIPMQLPPLNSQIPLQTRTYIPRHPNPAKLCKAHDGQRRLRTDQT